MKKLPVHLIPLTLATALFAGCGGGGQGSSLPSAGTLGGAAGPPVASGSSSVAMVIAIPSSSTASASVRRLPQYLPSNVASMSVVITQGSTPVSSQTIQLTAGSPGCSATAPVTCTATFQVPIGNDTFALTSYDATKPTPNAISHAQVTKAIVAGVNQLPVTLNGIVADVAVIPGLPDYSIYEGATSKGNTQTASISVTDADGNTIVGVFDSAITITADGTLFTIAPALGAASTNTATFTTSGGSLYYGYNLPDPYTSKPTFSAGTGIFLAQPQIDNAGTLVPENSTGHIALWYDFADTNPALFTAPGGQISAWQDRNGSTNAVTQALASAQPSIVQGGFTHNPNQNILQNVAFSAGQCLVSAAGFPSGDYTIFAVAIGSAAPGTLVGPFGTPGTAAHSLTIPNASEIDVIDHGAVGPALTGLTLTGINSYYVTATIQDAANTASGYFHSSTLTTGPISSALQVTAETRDPGLAINGANSVCSGAAANQFGEVIILDHSASDKERLAITEYLHRKWDI